MWSLQGEPGSRCAGPGGAIPPAGLQAASPLLMLRVLPYVLNSFIFQPGSWRTQQRNVQKRLLPSQLPLSSACSSQAALRAHQPHLSLRASPKEQMLLRPRAGCELGPKRAHFLLCLPLAQCGKLLSNNKLGPKQLFHFFSLLLLIVCFWKRKKKKKKDWQIQWSWKPWMDPDVVWAGFAWVPPQSSANAFLSQPIPSLSSKPWPLPCRQYQVRKNWDVLLGGFELWILAYRKCFACFLHWPDAEPVLGFQRRKAEQD